MNNPFNKCEAFTGLEVAIIFIAFVVVAATFSYVILGVGFFTIQKSQEVIDSGVKQSSSSIKVVGDVHGLSDNPSLGIDTIQFTICLTVGGTPVDFDTVTMTYSTPYIAPVLLKPANCSPGGWDISSKTGGTDNFLELLEQFVINVHLPSNLRANEKFNLEIKPSAGVVLAIKRDAPTKILQANVLY
ncbi:MAG: flagellin [Euryarchaeota archaeon]|nr:flagellin [Euryarchaeota archaeon]